MYHENTSKEYTQPRIGGPDMKCWPAEKPRRDWLTPLAFVLLIAAVCAAIAFAFRSVQ